MVTGSSLHKGLVYLRQCLQNEYLYHMSGVCVKKRMLSHSLLPDKGVMSLIDYGVVTQLKRLSRQVLQYE
jgi:hypothetical protein